MKPIYKVKQTPNGSPTIQKLKTEDLITFCTIYVMEQTICVDFPHNVI